MKKAQAAMEYLMTYGWAIIIVIIVAAALYAMGLFSGPGGQTIATRFDTIGKPPAGAWELIATTGAFAIKSSNNAPFAVNVTSLSVSYGAGLPCTNVAINAKTNIGAGIWLGIGSPYNITASCGTPSSQSTYNIDIQMSGLNEQGMTFSDVGRVTGIVA